MFWTKERFLSLRNEITPELKTQNARYSLGPFAAAAEQDQGGKAGGISVLTGAGRQVPPVLLHFSLFITNTVTEHNTVSLIFKSLILAP